MRTALICAAQAPFVVGGAEILVSELRRQLERHGFRVDVANVLLAVVLRQGRLRIERIDLTGATIHEQKHTVLRFGGKVLLS